MTRSGFRSRRPRRTKNAAPHMHSMLTLLFLSLFLVSSASTWYLKAQAVSEAVLQTSQEIKASWEGNLSARAAIIHYASHGTLDDAKVREYMALCDVFDEAAATAGARKLESLTTAALVAHEWAHTIERLGVTFSIDLAYSPAIDPQSIELLSESLTLASDLHNGKISIKAYRERAAMVRARENAYVDRHLASFPAAETSGDGSKEIEMKLAALQQQVERLNTTAKVPYSPGFWIAVGAAVCSWMVMLSNFLFSFFKEKRERRKEEREDATVLVYSASDIQRVVYGSQLNRRLRN